MAFEDRMRWFNPPTPPPLTEDATGRLTRRDLDEEEKDQLRRLLQQFQISQDEAQQMNAGPHQMGFGLPNRGSSQRGQGQGASPLDPFKKEYEQSQAQVAAKVSEAVRYDEPFDMLNRRRLVESYNAGGFGREPAPPDAVHAYGRALDINDAQVRALRLASGITGQEHAVTGGQPFVKGGPLEANSVPEFLDLLKNGGGEQLDPYSLTFDQRDMLKKAMPLFNAWKAKNGF